LLDLEELGVDPNQLVSLGPRYLHGFDMPQEVFHITDTAMLARAEPLALQVLEVTP
jgi:hypothetical protein